MTRNSVRGYAKAAEAIAEPYASGLERSCSSAGRPDGIVEAQGFPGIERIEARFRGNGFEPHRHDTYALGLTLTGVQSFHYRGVARASLPGNIIVLHPDELHDGAAGTETGLTYRMLYLPPERLLEAAGMASALPFVANPVIVDEAFRLDLADALQDLDTAPADLQVDDMLARLSESLWRNADDRRTIAGAGIARAAILRCRDFLTEHCERQVSSAELETISGLDRYTTARQFRRLLGTSPHRYLVMRRLDRAKSLIAAGAGLAEAALETGFADQAHLTRHFKKTFGMTPGRWLGLTSAARSSGASNYHIGV